MQNDPNIKGASVKAEEEFKKQYPAVYSYLEGHKEKLSKRNKAETGIRYEWYALQRWGSNYSDDFNKQKLIWTPVNSEYKFTVIPEGYFFNNSIFMITGNDLYYLCGILNSSLYQKYFEMVFTNGSYNYGSASNIKKLPIITLPNEIHSNIEELVKTILSENKLELCSQIDNLIYTSLGIKE